MTTGAQRADAHPEGEGPEIHHEDWHAPVPEGEYPEEQPWAYADPVARPWGAWLLGAFLILLALGWTAASVWTVRDTALSFTIPQGLSWLASLSMPLVLLGIAWLLLGQTPRRETERFTRAVAALRNESGALESILAIVAARLEENHSRLTNEAAKLMSLGDEASDRLGRVTHYLAKETATLDRKAEALETAAQAARIDIGVLLHDLPRAEEQARMVADAMKSAGLTAHEQAGALEGQLSALVARGREADDVVGGAAQRLGAHLARIESTSASAATRMDDAALGMTAAVDGTMARAADAVDAARSSLEAQGAAMLAMIEQSRAALDRAGEDAGRNLAQRLEHIGGKIETLASHLAAQDAASHALVTGLAKEFGELDERFAAFIHTGAGGTDRLAQSLGTMRVSVEDLSIELNGGHRRAADLIERGNEMARAFGIVAGQLTGELPEALARVEDQAGRAGATAAAMVPAVDAIQASAEAAAARLGEAEASLTRQREGLDALIARLDQGVLGAEEQLRTLGAAIGEADGAATRLAADTGPELVDALVRVREAATQAAERAREAISAVIPQSAAALGEAARRAVGQAITGSVEQQMGQLAVISQRAVEVARRASERLTRQMLTIGETTATIEARIEEERTERAEHENNGFARRASLLIESINSTAIDVTKILSNEVTDSAWASYLKGDRGVFTRRAVRLLDSGEARAIAQHYEEEPEFREQVNRYIHDFEAMLRPILADRDGSVMGITLLSSDMGKLYVALAQAIERLR
jgi:hypothetical protein